MPQGVIKPQGATVKITYTNDISKVTINDKEISDGQETIIKEDDVIKAYGSCDSHN